MTKAISFDFNELALDDTAELHLEHPKTAMPLYAPVAKGEPEDSKPVLVTLHGPASDKYRKAMDLQNKRANKRGKREPTPQESREDNVEFLTAISVSIANITFDGETVDNADAFRKLYSNPKWEWVAKQIGKFVFEDGNFLK